MLQARLFGRVQALKDIFRDGRQIERTDEGGRKRCHSGEGIRLSSRHDGKTVIGRDRAFRSRLEPSRSRGATDRAERRDAIRLVDEASATRGRTKGVGVTSAA